MSKFSPIYTHLPQFIVAKLWHDYGPKGMELTGITDEQVQMAVERLNHRPRKVLGFRMRHEVFFGVDVLYTKQPLDVVLPT